MDRWNELIAGHVLGNLTAKESEELAQILVKNPQLNEEILRLRRTATMRSKLPDSLMAADLSVNQRTEEGAQPTIGSASTQRFAPAGSEGWTDGLSGRLSPTARWKIEPALAPKKGTPPLQPLTYVSSQRPLNNNHRNRRRVCAYAKNALRNPLWWLLVLVTIGLGIDNVRVRRSLALIQDKTTYTHREKTHSTLWQPSDSLPKTQ